MDTARTDTATGNTNDGTGSHTPSGEMTGNAGLLAAVGVIVFLLIGTAAKLAVG